MKHEPRASTRPLLFDFLRSQALVFEELRRIHTLVVERLLPANEPLTPAPAQPGGGGPLDHLSRLQALFIEHPLAAQAAFSALIAEGRRFAATPDGAAWKSALASSDIVRQGRQVWDALALNLLEENTSTVLPSAYLEAFFQAATSSGLDGVLKRLRAAAMGGDHGTLG